jgi:hypothetical protein
MDFRLQKQGIRATLAQLDINKALKIGLPCLKRALIEWVFTKELD